MRSVRAEAGGARAVDAQGMGPVCVLGNKCIDAGLLMPFFCQKTFCHNG